MPSSALAGVASLRKPTKCSTATTSRFKSAPLPDVALANSSSRTARKAETKSHFSAAAGDSSSGLRLSRAADSARARLTSSFIGVLLFLGRRRLLFGPAGAGNGEAGPFGGLGLGTVGKNGLHAPAGDAFSSKCFLERHGLARKAPRGEVFGNDGAQGGAFNRLQLQGADGPAEGLCQFPDDGLGPAGSDAAAVEVANGVQPEAP